MGAVCTARPYVVVKLWYVAGRVGFVAMTRVAFGGARGRISGERNGSGGGIAGYWARRCRPRVGVGEGGFEEGGGGGICFSLCSLVLVGRSVVEPRRVGRRIGPARMVRSIELIMFAAGRFVGGTTLQVNKASGMFGSRLRRRCWGWRRSSCVGG